MTAFDLQQMLIHFESLSDLKRAKGAARFFKTGAGQYGQDDQFIGLTNPQLHQLVKHYYPLTIENCELLLKQPIHEIRLFALLMLVKKYQPKKSSEKLAIVECYLRNTQYINNWDLVDCSAYKILGAHCLQTSTQTLITLAKSENLWQKRIAIVATYAMIKQNQFQATFEIAEILLQDDEDLIQKAVGWMLKEVGKRNQPALIEFLQSRASELPRTLLRTAVEKLPVEIKRSLMQRELID